MQTVSIDWDIVLDLWIATQFATKYAPLIDLWRIYLETVMISPIKVAEIFKHKLALDSAAKYDNPESQQDVGHVTDLGYVALQL